MKKSPITLGLTSATLGLTLAFPTFAEADFFEDSKADLEFRNFYFNSDYRQPNASQSKRDEWAQGLILNYQSGYTEGLVGFGIDAIGLQGLKLDSSPDRQNTGLLPVGEDGAPDSYSRMGATAKARISKSVLKFGTLIPKLPTVLPNDGRLLPQTFRGTQLTSQDIAGILNGVVGGTAITQVRDSIYLVNVVGRARAIERTSLDTLQSLQVGLSNGTVVPLLAFAKIDYDLEQPIVWRRNRVATITVRAAIMDDTQPPTVVAALQPDIDAFVKSLPEGYTLETGGAVEEAAKGQGPIAAVVPVMLLTMAFFLMVQLQSVGKLLLVFSVAPLGLIGVVPALLLFDKPMGFVAILGILALIGIIVRNAVILVSQIEECEAEGLAPWDAVVEATRHRMRPILLTAAAASLGLIPIAREVFWGPMAYAMIGGILAATLLTLLFLPALYVGCYRIQPPKAA
nr:OprD family outer membrane porin [uncultured Methylobacterium sp.]